MVSRTTSAASGGTGSLAQVAMQNAALPKASLYVFVDRDQLKVSKIMLE